MFASVRITLAFYGLPFRFTVFLPLFRQRGRGGSGSRKLQAGDEPFCFGSLLYAATATNKHENQDGFAIFKTPGTNVFAVADGIGSFAYPAVASSEAIRYLETHCNELSADRQDLKMHFLAVQQRLAELAQTDFRDENPERLLGTTLIVGVESEDKVTFAYVGNGAILHLRGTLPQFADADDSWYAANLLSPHTVPEKGREALYGFLSNGAGAGEPQPTRIEVDKDPRRGDVFVICTDGIFSADHQEAYRTPKIGLLYKFDDRLAGLLRHLREYAAGRSFGPQSLKECIDCYLAECKPSLADDSTLAVVVTGAFIRNNSL